MVVSEEVAQSEPPAAQVTAPDVGQTESGAAAAASEGVAPSVPPEAQAKVAATVMSLAGLDTAIMASEGAAQSAPPTVQAAAPEVGRRRRIWLEGLWTSWRWWRGPAGGCPQLCCEGASIPRRGASRRSSGWMLGTQSRLYSRLTMLLRAWSGRTLTSGSRL